MLLDYDCAINSRAVGHSHPDLHLPLISSAPQFVYDGTSDHSVSSNSPNLIETHIAKVTMSAPLHSQPIQRAPASIVETPLPDAGDCIAVLCPEDDAFYPACVARVSSDGILHILHEDGGKESLHLRTETCSPSSVPT